MICGLINLQVRCEASRETQGSAKWQDSPSVPVTYHRLCIFLRKRSKHGEEFQSRGGMTWKPAPTSLTPASGVERLPGKRGNSVRIISEKSLQPWPSYSDLVKGREITGLYGRRTRWTRVFRDLSSPQTDYPAMRAGCPKVQDTPFQPVRNPAPSLHPYGASIYRSKIDKVSSFRAFTREITKIDLTQSYR